MSQKLKYAKYFVVSTSAVVAVAGVVPFSASAENVEINIKSTDDTKFSNKFASLSVDSTAVTSTTGDTSELTTEDTFTLSIIHTNDTHANIANAPKRATIINNVREEKPNALLLDAGDVFQGTLYFTQYKGQADLELMNYMGYDAMTLGNHEFDLGKTAEGHQALVDFIKNATFPILTANVNFSADNIFDGLYHEGIATTADVANIYDGLIIEVEGEEIGIFGLTTETTAGSSSPEKVTFENYIEEAEKAVQSLEDQGVDKIVALTHLGFNNPADSNDLLLAEEVEGIDIIVGGHSHTTLTEAYVVDENAEGE
ncbi:bifunctional metallophosphatase/5'-nucleotidase, partial [Butyricicoccus sp. 1XD8-22]